MFFFIVLALAYEAFITCSTMTYPKYYIAFYSDPPLQFCCRESLSGSVVELPDTLQEVFDEYNIAKGPRTKVTVHTDVTSEHDIYLSVLHNVIHVSL